MTAPKSRHEPSMPRSDQKTFLNNYQQVSSKNQSLNTIENNHEYPKSMQITMTQFHQMQAKQPHNINFNNQIQGSLPMVTKNRNMMHESPNVLQKSSYKVNNKNSSYQQTPLLTRKTKPESMQLPTSNFKGANKFKDTAEQIIDSMDI